MSRELEKEYKSKPYQMIYVIALSIANICLCVIWLFSGDDSMKFLAISSCILTVILGLSFSFVTMYQEDILPYRRGSVYNVLEHGVKGDGIHDDTKAIKKLLRKYKKGDTLYFPRYRHQYLISEKIPIPEDCNVDANFQDFILSKGV